MQANLNSSTKDWGKNSRDQMMVNQVQGALLTRSSLKNSSSHSVPGRGQLLLALRKMYFLFSAFHFFSGSYVPQRIFYYNTFCDNKVMTHFFFPKYTH